MQLFNIEEMLVYEDKEIIVCRKPSGIAVQNARFGVLDMESGLKNYLAAKNPGQMPYLGIVHRLDQPMEGLLVFAKTKQAAAELSRQISAGTMGKCYLAVTSGAPKNLPNSDVSKHLLDSDSPKGLEGILEDYLKKDARTNSSSVVSKGTPESKLARLSYKILQECEEPKVPSGKKKLVYICLDTGRHHQIRVQMAHAGMPLIGDRKYNGTEQTTLPLGLCSFQLEFKHPKTKKQMSFEIFPSGEAFQGFSREKIS